MEVGEKGQTSGADAHIGKLSFNTHPAGGGLLQRNLSLFRHSLVKDGRVQWQETEA